MPQLRIAKRVRLPGVGMVDVERVVDCRGMSCPKPQLVVREEIREMRSGEVAEVLIDNPVEGSDVSATMVSGIIRGRKALILGKVRGGSTWKIYFQKR
jgi:TusA-related sulfurtransferase